MSTERWEIDSSHSSLHFSVRHLMIAKVRGAFARWSGTVQVPDSDVSKATVAVTIDASSIETGVPDRDGHLKSPDFFDAAQYPELRFVGTRVQPRSGDQIDVIGDLTIRGITREVVLRVEQHGQAKDPWGNVRAAFSAKTTIDRGLRPDVEPGARDRRRARRRQGRDRGRDPSREAGCGAGCLR